MNEENNLTIEDIHKIRFENYELTKDLSFEELIKETHLKAGIFKRRLKKYSKNYCEDLDQTDILVAEAEVEYGKKK